MLTLFELQQRVSCDLQDESLDDASYIKSNSVLSAEQQLAIYRNSIEGALQKTLKNIFPVCYKLVGNDFFMGMANLYIVKTPSYSSNLNDYGQDFPSFISDFPPAQILPYLTDVARLEWAWHQLFSAPNTNALDVEKLRQFSTYLNEKIIFLLPPHYTLLSTPYPIGQIWEYNQDAYQGQDSIILIPDKIYYFLIWRKGLEMRIDPLHHEEWQVLTWMQAKLPFSDICKKAKISFPKTDIIKLWTQFVTNGWLTDFIVNMEY